MSLKIIHLRINCKQHLSTGSDLFEDCPWNCLLFQTERHMNIWISMLSEKSWVETKQCSYYTILISLMFPSSLTRTLDGLHFLVGRFISSFLRGRNPHFSCLCHPVILSFTIITRQETQYVPVSPLSSRHISFSQFYREISDIHPCVNLSHTAWWCDIHVMKWLPQ